MGETFLIPKERIPELAKVLRISTGKLTDILSQTGGQVLVQQKAKPQLVRRLRINNHIPSQSCNPDDSLSLRERVSIPRVSRKVVATSSVNQEIPNVQWYIDCWIKHGCPKLREGSKSQRESVDALGKLIAGTFFNRLSEFQDYAHHPFTSDDWLTSVSRFSLSRNNIEYRPVKKTTIKGYNIAAFIFNPLGRLSKSLFLHFLENEPEFFTPKDKYPKITSSLIKLYSKYCVNGYSPSRVDMVNLIAGAKRTHNFFKINKRHIAYLDLDFRTPWQKAEIVMKTLEWLAKGNHIPPHFFNTDGLYDQDLPRYLDKIGVWQR